MGYSYLVIPFTQELEFLGFFVHENSLQVPCVGWPQLNGLLSPTHHLVGLQVGWRDTTHMEMRRQTLSLYKMFPSLLSLGHTHIHTHASWMDQVVTTSVWRNCTNWCRHLPPLQHRVLSDPAVCVNVDALVFVANQNLCSSTVWQNNDGMGIDGALDLWTNTHYKQKRYIQT